MCAKEKLKRLLIKKKDPVVKQYADDWINKVEPNEIRLVDNYGEIARLRTIHSRNPDGTFLETSKVVKKRNDGSLIITDEGTFISDGK